MENSQIKKWDFLENNVNEEIELVAEEIKEKQEN